jgi:hypothetical protein
MEGMTFSRMREYLSSDRGYEIREILVYDMIVILT